MRRFFNVLGVVCLFLGAGIAGPGAAACLADASDQSCRDLSIQANRLHAERKYSEAGPLLQQLETQIDWRACPTSAKATDQAAWTLWQDNFCPDLMRLLGYYMNGDMPIGEDDLILFALRYDRKEALAKVLRTATALPANLTGAQLDVIAKVVLRDRSPAAQTNYARLILISALPPELRDPRYIKALKTAAKRSPVAAYMIWTDDSGAFSSAVQSFYLNKAVDAGNPDALFVAATRALEAGQTDEGNALMLRAAKAGFAAAQTYVDTHKIVEATKPKRPPRDPALEAQLQDLFESTESGCNAFWRRDRSVDARSYCACVKSYAERRLGYEDPVNIMLFNVFASSNPLEAKLRQVQLGYDVLGPKSGYSQNTVLRMQLVLNGAMARCGPSMRRK